MSADLIAKCPFCGNGGRSDPRHTFDRRGDFLAVACGSCGALGPFVRARQTDAEDLALGAWNRRAALSARPKEAAPSEDTARIDWLEAKINAEGEIHLHDGQHPRGSGLGLRPGTLSRTLREAIDAARPLAATQAPQEAKP